MMKKGGFSGTSIAALYDECNIFFWNGFQYISIEHCNRDDAEEVRMNCQEVLCNLNKVVLGMMSLLVLCLFF